MKSLLQITNDILGSRHSVDNGGYNLLSQVPEDIQGAIVQANMYLFNLENWNFRIQTHKTIAAEDTRTIELPVAGAIVKSVRLNGRKTLRPWDATFETLTLSELVKKDMEVEIEYFTPLSVVVLDEDSQPVSFMTNFDFAAVDGNQYVNCPFENVQDVFEQCVILRSRVLLNQGLQPEAVGNQATEYRDMLKTLYKVDAGAREMRVVI